MSFFRRVATHVYAPTCNRRRSISLGIVAVAAVLFGPAMAHSQSVVHAPAVQTTTAGRKYLVTKPTKQPQPSDRTIFFGAGMRNIGKNIFAGPRHQYRRLAANIDGPPPPNGFEIPSIDIKSNSAALGLQVERDLRDNTFYPTKGSLFDFTADFFDQTWGSRREFPTYKTSFNGFHELRKRHVFAYRLMGCPANGSVPFYDLCLLGFNNDLRGYTTGEFQNRRMFATQGEYRIDWRSRPGFVGFGGV